MPVDLAVRDWARHDQAVAERLRRVDNRRMDYLRELIAAVVPGADDVEARCFLAFSLAIGSHLIAADGDHDELVRSSIRHVLADPSTSEPGRAHRSSPQQR